MQARKNHARARVLSAPPSSRSLGTRSSARLSALVVAAGLCALALSPSPARADDTCSEPLAKVLKTAHAHFKTNVPYAKDEPASKDNKVFYIENNAHNLDTVMAKLVELGERKPGREKVRIALYGDSNHVPDYASGAWRTILGSWFGYGGHGFVGAAKPWPVYNHREIAHKTRSWSSYAASTPKADRAIYGHAGMVGTGNGRGAYVEFSPREEGAEANRTFSKLTATYLCNRRGGDFEIIVDGKALKTVSTQCDKEQYGSATVTVPNGEHTVRFKVTKRSVTFFGAVFENDKPGVIVDGLGVGALNLAMLSDSDAEIFKASMKDRNYDMVAFHTGTNMWAPNVHPKWAKTVIGRVREALGPDVAIIFLSPPDFARRRGPRRVSNERMQECGKEKQQIAKDLNFAFWDFFNASGGLGAISNWDDKKLVHGDLVHYKQPFHQKMAQRFAWAFLHSFENYLIRKGHTCETLVKRPSP